MSLGPGLPLLGFHICTELLYPLSQPHPHHPTESLAWDSPCWVSQGMGALWWPQRNCSGLPWVLLRLGKSPSVGPGPRGSLSHPTPKTRPSISVAGTSVRHDSHFPGLAPLRSQAP